jgi:hypothetical protein
VRSWGWMLGAMGAWIGLGGCGSDVVTYRYRAVPDALVSHRGEPVAQSYRAQVEVDPRRLRAVIFQRNTCHALRSVVGDLVHEKLVNGKVAERRWAGRAQLAYGYAPSVRCHERLAPGVRVGLRMTPRTYPIGITDGRGVVEADMRGILSMEAEAAGWARLAVVVVEDRDGRRHEAGSIALRMLVRATEGPPVPAP